MLKSWPLQVAQLNLAGLLFVVRRDLADYLLEQNAVGHVVDVPVLRPQCDRGEAQFFDRSLDTVYGDLISPTDAVPLHVAARRDVSRERNQAEAEGERGHYCGRAEE